MGNFEKRPKTNNKGWIKLSEAHLSILGDCWEKLICSSLPASLMEEFPASKVHLYVHPETWLTGKFIKRRISRHYWPVWVWGHKEKFRPSVCWCVGGGGGAGGAVGKTMGVAEGCDSPLQWEVGGLSDNLNKATTLDKKYAQTPRIVFFPKTLSFHEHIITYTSPILQKLACRTDSLRNKSIRCPWRFV